MMLWPMILESVKKFGQFWIITFLIAYIVWLKFENNNLQLELVKSQSFIAQLETQSQVEAKRLDKANKDAAKWHKDYLTKNYDILNAVVPDNCDEAIKWAIQQAKR